MNMEEKRRLPGKEKNIKDIVEEDFRVTILGTVVDLDKVSNTAMIDDGTGRVLLLFPDSAQLEPLEAGKPVRVIGRVRKEENIEIEVEIIQDMSKLDLGLYEQVKYISERILKMQ